MGERSSDDPELRYVSLGFLFENDTQVELGFSDHQIGEILHSHLSQPTWDRLVKIRPEFDYTRAEDI